MVTMTGDLRAALAADGGGTRIRVRVVARASASGIAGLHDDAIRLRIAAPPVEGKANAAVVRFLAGLLEVRASDLRIVAGERSRTKIVAVAGLAPDVVAVRLAGA
jgi:hypothetical protein